MKKLEYVKAVIDSVEAQLKKYELDLRTNKFWDAKEAEEKLNQILGELVLK